MNSTEGKANDMSRSATVSTKQRRIAELAKDAPDMAMDLSHHMDMEWMEEAYRRTRKDGAVGVDGQSAQDYAEELQGNLQLLIDRAKSGRYRAPAVKRVHIPKEGKRGATRPLGIPTFEDKVLQRGVLMLLEPVYEQDFEPCSYGFRPGRSQHQALSALRRGLMQLGGGYVIDLDIRRYFDTIDHRQIQQIFRQRIRDGVLRRLIGKWLNAGVMHERRVSYPEEGVPQGGVISPLLSNIYLHEVLDRWFREQVQPRLRGGSMMVRFADDAVLVFEQEGDARRVLEVLPRRFEKYGLELHPEKTRLVRFKRPRQGRDVGGDDDTPGTFNFLGFTHYWGKTRKGGWAVKHRTAKERLKRSIQRAGRWLRRERHQPIAKQHATLRRKILGHINYYGVTGNISAIRKYIHEVERLWCKWLGRRSRKARKGWEWYKGLLKRFPLPRSRLPHAVNVP